jgi:bifunctional non-homologous end joining protein LigD
MQRAGLDVPDTKSTMLPATCPFAPALEHIGLMQPLPAPAPFTSPEWSFELPLQGHRVLAEAMGPGSRLLAPGALEVSRRFPEVVQALRQLPPGRHVFDAELCVLDACGRNDTQRLHERALARTPPPDAPPASLVVHDLLVLGGTDLRALPWRLRRALLKRLPLEGVLRVQRTLSHEGEWLYRQAQALDRPVLHARRCDAPYVGGRSEAWLAIPCRAVARPAPSVAVAAAWAP